MEIFLHQEDDCVLRISTQAPPEVLQFNDDDLERAKKMFEIASQLLATYFALCVIEQYRRKEIKDKTEPAYW